MLPASPSRDHRRCWANHIDHSVRRVLRVDSGSALRKAEHFLRNKLRLNVLERGLLLSRWEEHENPVWGGFVMNLGSPHRGLESHESGWRKKCNAVTVQSNGKCNRLVEARICFEARPVSPHCFGAGDAIQIAGSRGFTRNFRSCSIPFGKLGWVRQCNEGRPSKHTTGRQIQSRNRSLPIDNCFDG
jgi:hypothetical protein